MSSSAMEWISWSSGFWKTKPTSIFTLLSSVFVEKLSTVTEPLSGIRRPFKCFAKVVLPEPFLPMIAAKQPSLNDAERFPSTLMPSYEKFILVIFIIPARLNKFLLVFLLLGQISFG